MGADVDFLQRGHVHAVADHLLCERARGVVDATAVLLVARGQVVGAGLQAAVAAAAGSRRARIVVPRVGGKLGRADRGHYRLLNRNLPASVSTCRR